MKKRFIGILVVVLLVLIMTLLLWKTGVVFNAIANNIYNDLNSSQITYEEAKEKLNLLDKVGDVSWVYDKCDKLNNSQYSYRYAVELQGKKDYKTAIFEFDKVIQEDLNYENAKKTIEEIRTLAYDDIVNTLNEYLKNENYVDAFKIIENAEKIFKNDEKISSFKIDFSKIKERVEIEKEIEMCDLNTAEGIEKYVTLKYGKLENTPLGDWEFDVVANDNGNDSLLQYDFCIYLYLTMSDEQLKYFKRSLEVTEEARREMDSVLKNHIETLANDLISKMPDKKIVGHYDQRRYETTGDWFYAWANYKWDNSADYYSTSLSTFRWLDFTKGLFN